MNGRTLLRRLRKLTGIRYNIQSSANDKGWAAYLQIVTKSKENYIYTTGDKRYIRRSGAEYSVAKSAAIDICRLYNLRNVLEDDMMYDDTAASKMNNYVIDFNNPISPPPIMPTMLPSWYTSSPPDSPDTVQSTDYTKVVMVDLENVPLLNCKQYAADTLYIGFLTVHHNSAYKYKDWDAYHDFNFQCPSSNNKCIYYTDGRYKEMVDHFMTFMSRSIVDYICSNLQSCDTIYILSKDNSALCTKKCIKSIVKNSNTSIKVKLISSLQQI